ncbi:hypothetical protein [Flavobacterium sp. C4GT6]|uniref:hypothetical protein n=1 Tax=Flavobacterium sp. C4GT6 TaxID=3103818 RepID=UPI002ED18F25
MKLDAVFFEDASKGGGVIKATIHKTGKLGFSAAAQEFIGINENTYFLVGFNEENQDDFLYLVSSPENDKAFKVSKAGDYFYINLKYVFDKRGIDYKNETIIFDIKKETENDIEFYLLTKRSR